MLSTKAVSLFRFVRERNGLIDTVVCVFVFCYYYYYYSYLFPAPPPYTTCNVLGIIKLESSQNSR